jgi:type II secretory pathway predicted ATPase ExeA
MTLRLKAVLSSLGVSQRACAQAVGIARWDLNELVNLGRWPRSADRRALTTAIKAFVAERGGKTRGLLLPEKASPAEHPGAATEPAAPPAPPESDHEPVQLSEEEESMLLRKQSLTPEARRHFQLARDPFADPATHEDVYLNGELRYVRESMYQVARHGGFLAVIGESGAGKSTLREELISRLQREEQAVIVIEPYVLAMEAQDKVGKTLRSHHVAEAIMASIAPLARQKSSPEARFRQLHQSLRDSARAGHSHVLLIEEAHCLPLPTLKHLKRFRELKDGLRPLLSVILLGQPELAVKLSEHNPEVREVVQRIEIVTLPALAADLEGYVKHRFARAGRPLDQVLAKDALEALRTKLTPSRAGGTLLYPLAVANALAAAMNRAAEIKFPQVNADLIRGV